MEFPLKSREACFSQLPDLPPDGLAFARHYFNLPVSGGVPTLEAFLDTAPIELMPRVTICDMLSAHNFKMRYFGTALAELVGRDYTGSSAVENRRAGIIVDAGTYGWEAARHPCGFLAKRTIMRRARPEKLEAVFEVLTLGLPISVKTGVPCIVHYNSIPNLSSDKRSRNVEVMDGYTAIPICWLDIGAGMPRTPI